jgi:hypothetical protein
MSRVTGISSVSSYLNGVDLSTMTETDLDKLEEELNEKYEQAYQEKLMQMLNGSDDTIAQGQTILAEAEDAIDNLNALIQTVSSSDADSISKAYSSFSTSYRSLISSLSSDGSKAMIALKQAMAGLFSEYSDQIETIGAASGEDGTDEEATNAAKESLKELFGADSTFVKSMTEYFNTAATVASMNISHYRSQQTLYSSTGSYSSTNNMNKSLIDAFF